ncbi:MAG: DNA methyltransferase [Phycisphaerales bacterium]|nr:DNA methyltransferase [Phycisphaerales bacterium]
MENINDLMPLSKDWNKERLTQLKNLFPDLFTNEGKLNIEELKKVVDPASVSETERYEFRWFGKSAAKRNAYTPSNATLMYDEKRSINPNENENLIIEGENLEVLKLLSESYREKIKCIYIDPPYNTGKDFVYSDNYTQDKKAYWEENGVFKDGLKIDTNSESDGRYHSNWLNMMYSRLLISRQLLKADGVIFISIDDNEVHHLRKLCDEVFGEENFIAEIPWKGKGGGADNNFLMVAHEYIIFYAKSKEYFEVGEETKENEVFSKYDEIKKRNYKTQLARKWGANSKRTDRPNLYYPVLSPDNIEIYPILPSGEEGCWRWSKEKMKREMSDGNIEFVKDGDNCIIYEKIYEPLDGGYNTKKYSTWLDDVGNTATGTKEFGKLFDSKVFNFPKPTILLKRLFNIADFANGDIILDFFGGSGTTGQAVMELNQEDGGNRKFILVQIPEATEENSEAHKAGYKKISDITIERNKRLVEKIIEEKKKQQPNLFTNGHKDDAINGLGFKVFKLVKSNFPRVEWAPDIEKTDEENIVSFKKYITDKEYQLVTLFNRNELLTEILLKNGFQLNYKTDKEEQFKKNEILLATDGIKKMFICMDNLIDTETIEQLKKMYSSNSINSENNCFICLERALDTTKKYNLKHYLDNWFKAF